jgi:hypothetical protein
MNGKGGVPAKRLGVINLSSRKKIFQDRGNPAFI